MLAGLMLFLGLAAAGGGVAYAINGATQAQADVTVNVKARTTEGLRVETSGGDSTSKARLAEPSGDDNKITLDVPGAEQGSRLEAGTDALELRAWGSTIMEQLLSRGDSAILGLSFGGGALLLRGLLLSIAEGEPFRRGNAARIAGIAALTAAGSYGAALTPGLASGLVLERVGLDGPGSPITPSAFLAPLPALLAALLLLAVAEAFRRGTELAQDVDGLV
ncbi:hypothetical protein G4Z16_21950 [Streptomyces bathyalis]|uniref:DUF2975 domain-containing protein n=1 Tax=Streptomyces bathyalis TaxID=2710756 RepID=A0A7T1WTY7_9ACTN|nr:hypothetical protein [Streptomyces bathyalis]QPP08622.1 hypothetical protein G4Z16_21950 [Streptomyces bathyalis]